MNDIVNFTAGIDGTITATVLTPLGVAQNLTGCQVSLKIGFMLEDDAIVSKLMTVNSTICTANLTPTETENLSRGGYEAQIIIVDALGKKRATERQKLMINKIIN